jgi:hypothetical protein
MGGSKLHVALQSFIQLLYQPLGCQNFFMRFKDDRDIIVFPAGYRT